MADDLKSQVKLAQSLVMTPQLQMAIKLLGTPSSELAALIEPTPGVLPADATDPDPLQTPGEEELELQEETGVTPWSFLLEPPIADAGADVWVYGNPPIARANRAVLPRLKPDPAASPEDQRAAKWLFRSLRQRAKTFERVIEGLLELDPSFAIATSQLDPIPIRELAEKIGFHESTITRVASSCRVQNVHGVWKLAPGNRGIGLAVL